MGKTGKRHPVILRADGNNTIGLGHVIRSLALADMLKADFDCIFATRFSTPYIQKEIDASCSGYIKLPEGDEHFGVFLSTLTGDEIVVLDNYFYSTDYQKDIRSKGCKLVCIDDIHDKHFAADVVINHSGGFHASDYSIENDTKLFLGFAYALLREVFLETARYPKPENNDQVLLCLGGADPGNDTLLVLDHVMQKHPSLDYHVVLGNAFQHTPSIEKYTTGKKNVKIYRSLNRFELCDLMLRCSRAICSPSTVSMEYLCTKGALYLKCIADNQTRLYHYYLENNIGKDYTDFYQPEHAFNHDLIRYLFDGKQKDRIINIFLDL